MKAFNELIETMNEKEYFVLSDNCSTANNEIHFIEVDFDNITIEGFFKQGTITVSLGDILQNDIGRPQRISQDITKIIFEKCKFNTLEFGETLYRYEFKNCDIKKLEFKNTKDYRTNKTPISFNFNNTKISAIEINRSTFNGKFYINKDSTIKTIDEVKINDTTFEENFKLQNCDIKDIEINNTNFEKNADFYNSNFLQQNEIKLYAINFKGLAIFEKCKFNTKLILEFVTFDGMAQFRETQFQNGLDLDRTNIQKEINFYGVNGLNADNSIENTSQETYRIIKHNFLKLNNQIEANKFHMLELLKRKGSLGFLNNPLEWVIFNFHWYSSRFASNWILPIAWIIMVGTLTSIYFNYGQGTGISKCIIDIFKFVSIMSIEEFKRKDEYIMLPLVALLNKSLLGYLYYQFIMAIRKDTRH